jgi:threonine/homoserine/homoserine lactone efflux protein
LVLAITPGPGIAYVAGRTAAGGRSEGLASCLGTAIGGVIQVTAAALGLSVLIARSAFAFSAIKFAGAAYLIVLGVRLLLREPANVNAATRAQGARRAFAEGVLVEALNIKTALFFVAFLPQFVSTASALVPQILLLGSICVALNTLADLAAVLAAHHLLRSWRARPAHARRMNRISGLTMIGLGAGLALARRPT